MSSQASRNAPGPDLALAAGMSFEGLLVLPRDARIEGRVAGEVLASASVEVGPTGEVDADLEVNAALIDGRVLGGVRARESIALGPGAVVSGDLTAPRLAIAEGARVNGTCRCGTPPTDDPTLPEATPSHPDPASRAS